MAVETALAPSTLIASPSTYEEKPVTATGKVAKYQLASTLRGTIAFYQLCDTRCVVVIDESKPSYANGQQRTVSGTFHTQFKGPKRTFNNAIIVQ